MDQTTDHPLDTWLAANGLTRAQFAKAIDRSRTAVGRYCDASRIPDEGAMAAIERATGGAITANHFYQYRRDKSGHPHADAAPPPPTSEAA